MEITDIADNKTDTDGDIKRRTFINYPQVKCCGKAEKRINAFIIKIVDAYKKDASAASSYSYHRLKYRVCRHKPLSLFFESESRGKDGLFSYAPFSVTFSEHGYAVPLSLDKKQKRKVKRYFSDNGIRISYRDMKYSYYIDNNGDTVIYAKKSDKRRAKRSVVEYRAPSFAE